MKLAEGLVTDLQIFLQEKLAVKLHDVEGRYFDGLQLEVPKDYVISEMSLTEIQHWPCILILVPTSEISRWTVEYGETDHNLVLGVLLLDTDKEDLKRRLYRYLLAITELLIESIQSTELGWVPWGVVRLNYGAVYTKEKDFVADAQISVQMRARTVERME